MVGLLRVSWNYRVKIKGLNIQCKSKVTNLFEIIVSLSRVFIFDVSQRLKVLAAAGVWPYIVLLMLITPC